MSNLYSTENYHITVGENKEADHPLYQIVNTATGIIEYEDTILPRTLDACKNLQDLLDEAIINFNKKDDAPALELVKDEPIKTH